MTLSLRQRVRVSLGRARRWEFWPAWLFYIPVVIWILLLGLRYGRPTLFTAANPGMDDGGVVGERKAPLLEALRRTRPEATPDMHLLTTDQPLATKLAAVQKLAAAGYPIVLKPDIGQRGRGVLIAKSFEQAREYLERASFDVILQRFASGKEFGLFVYRDPTTGSVKLYSITAKELMHVHGDGHRPLHQLIWEHPRAWLMAPFFYERHRRDLTTVVPKGDEHFLVQVGSHCRGAVFLNGERLRSPALEAAVAQIVDALPGFHFGRLDVKAPSRQALSAGEGLQVLEINGVTAEAAHVYHPGTPLWEGYKSFFTQWRLAFAIGHANHRSGAPVVSPWRLLQLFLTDLKRFDVAESASEAARLS